MLAPPGKRARSRKRLVIKSEFVLTGDHLRRQLEEAGEAAALNVVVVHAVAEDMLAHGLRAVVLNLLIALRRALRRQQVWTGRRSVDYVDVEILSVAGKIGEWQSAANHAIDNLVLKFQIAEADAVGPRHQW